MDINFKSHWKDYLIAFLVIIAGIFAVAAVFYYHASWKKEQLVQASKILQNPAAQIVKKFTDPQGRQHVQIDAAANDIHDIPGSSTTDSLSRKSLIDTVKAALNLTSVKQIEELTREIVQLRAQIKLKPVTDSNGRKSLNYSDKWLNFHYNPDDTVVDLKYNASITAVKFHKSSWWPFAKTQSYIDFYGDDPRMKINGLSHFRVIQPEPLFGFSVDAKTSFFPYSGRLIPSFGAGLRIGRFTFEGREYYHDKFKPLISASYKFISL